MKRIISINTIALISIMSSSADIFYKIHSILIEHNILMQNNIEAIKGFTFNVYSITIQTGDKAITIINYPLIFSFSVLIYNVAEIIFPYIKSKLS